MPRPVAVLLLVCAGCGSTQVGERPDPARFEGCADEAGRRAFAEALVRIQAERDVEAVPLLIDALRACPDLVRAHLAYQDAARRLGGTMETAMLEYYRELPDRYDSPVPAYVKARLLDSAFLQKQALDGILQFDRSFYYAHFSLGRLMRANGKLATAADSFRNALGLNPNLLEAHLELAETLVELGREREAVVHLQNYLLGAPHDLEAARRYVHLLVYRLQRVDEALTWIERMLDRNPHDATVLMDKAAALWQGGQPEKARDVYLEVLQHRPDQARAVLNIGYLYYGVLAGDDPDSRRRLWPKARIAFQLYLRMARPQEWPDYVEQFLAVPFRLKEIDAVIPVPPPGEVPTLADLRPGPEGGA